MTDGFYRVAFTGAHGSGLGLLVLSRGVVAGADIGGVIYDGTYSEEASGSYVNLQLTMRAPAGSTLVQTGISLASPTDIPMQIRLPHDLAGGAPILLETPLGRVNVIVTKIRDLDPDAQASPDKKRE